MNKHHSIIRPLSLITCALILCGQSLQAQESGDRFQPGEWDVSPFATYVDKTGDDWGFGASLTYFVTRNIGVGASTYWTEFDGSLFDNVNAEAYFRLPIGRRVSPYAVGSVGYLFDTDEWGSTLGGGIDFRAFKKLSAFSDIQWRFTQDTQDGVFLRLGVRIAF